MPIDPASHPAVRRGRGRHPKQSGAQGSTAQAPRRPEQLLGEAKRRAYTPEEAGRPLGRMPLAWWDHVLTFLGTGLRFGELAGLRCRRVHLDRPVPVLQVVDVRYQAGSQFGNGFKGRPKSDAGIRELPLAPLVIESIRRQLPPDADPEVLVFTGPGGGNEVPVGTRTMLSRYNFRRVDQQAATRASSDLVEVDPHGPHDLRHSFSTWLEDAGIPARVIDQLMGHTGGRRQGGASGSPMGRVYRETTPTMLARVTAALDERIGRAMAVVGNLPRDAEGWTGTEAGYVPGAACCRFVRTSSTSSRPALRAASGRPPARRRRDGYLGCRPFYQV
jgi:integrase